MRPSKDDFIREQGFTTEGCQEGLYSALMFQPRVITGLVILGAVLQSPWIFLALAPVLWWGAFVPRHNPFDAFFNHAIADPMRADPMRADPMRADPMRADPMRLAAIPPAPPPRRFAQAMAGTFAMIVAMTLFGGVPHLAWLLEGVFVAATMSVVVRRLCLPARVYHRLWPRTPVTPCPSRSARVGISTPGFTGQ